MNKKLISNNLYYPITPEKAFTVTPNLAISTKDVAIRQHWRKGDIITIA